jgi:predicted nucleic acid-binding Zn ribbon protein
MAMEFSCPACGSPAVVYPDELTDDALVKCRRCEAVLCTLGELRSSTLEGAIPHTSPNTGGLRG